MQQFTSGQRILLSGNIVISHLFICITEAPGDSRYGAHCAVVCRIIVRKKKSSYTGEIIHPNAKKESGRKLGLRIKYDGKDMVALLLESLIATINNVL